MKETIIYCDGSSIGNPGPGGWGAVIERDGEVVELGGFTEETTNNRMELTAAIGALKATKKNAVVLLHTDSSYVINGITKWVKGWEKNGWQTKEKKDVLNKDLWQALQKATSLHTVEWKHVRGHMGVRLNERVDVIANGFARSEEVTLFSGNETAYEDFLQQMPRARQVKPKKTARTGKAYSYVSLVDGKIAVHKTWSECEARVKGKPAKFKKAFSKEEEDALMAAWKG